MRNKPLTPEDRARIRAVRKANPQMPYRIIGEQFGVTAATICVICTKQDPAPRAPQPPEPRKVTIALPKCAVLQADSTLAPIPMSRLMAGR